MSGAAGSPSDLLPHTASTMDGEERLLISDEGKRLSSKERRQLGNKVSARAFRSRRKEYISQFEGEVALNAQEASGLAEPFAEDKPSPHLSETADTDCFRTSGGLTSDWKARQPGELVSRRQDSYAGFAEIQETSCDRIHGSETYFPNDAVTRNASRDAESGNDRTHTLLSGMATPCPVIEEILVCESDHSVQQTIGGLQRDQATASCPFISPQIPTTVSLLPCLEAAVLAGDWEEVEATIFGQEIDHTFSGSRVCCDPVQQGLLDAIGFRGPEPTELKYLVRRQKYLELLERQDIMAALILLREGLTYASDVGANAALRELSSLMVLATAEEVRSHAHWNGALGGSRQQLYVDLCNVVRACAIDERAANALQGTTTHIRGMERLDARSDAVLPVGSECFRIPQTYVEVYPQWASRHTGEDSFGYFGMPIGPKTHLSAFFRTQGGRDPIDDTDQVSTSYRSNGTMLHDTRKPPQALQAELCKLRVCGLALSWIRLQLMNFDISSPNSLRRCANKLEHVQDNLSDACKQLQGLELQLAARKRFWKTRTNKYRTDLNNSEMTVQQLRQALNQQLRQAINAAEMRHAWELQKQSDSQASGDA